MAEGQPASARTGQGRLDVRVCAEGLYLEIETKIVTGRARIKQRQRIGDIRRAGGCAFIARDAQEMLRGTQLWVAGITPYQEGELDFLDQLPRPGQPTTAEPLEQFNEAPDAMVAAPEKPKRTRRKPVAPSEPTEPAPADRIPIEGTSGTINYWPDGTPTTQDIGGVTAPATDDVQPGRDYSLSGLSGRLGIVEEQLLTSNSRLRQLVDESGQELGLLKEITNLLTRLNERVGS